MAEKVVLPIVVVLPIAPEEYLFNGSSNCGVYVAKGVLSAYGLDKYDDPRDYHTGFLGKKFGWTLVGDLIATLKNFGLNAKKEFAQGNTKQKIKVLKNLLQEGNPVILNIGSCYDIRSRWIAKIIPHWITVWGYDETSFFVYDSSVPLNRRNLSLPIGNRQIEHQDLIWYWGAAHWFKVKGIFGRRYLYLSVELEKAEK